MPRSMRTTRATTSPVEVEHSEAPKTVHLDWVGAKRALRSTAALEWTSDSDKIKREINLVNKQLRARDELVSQSRRARMAHMLANLPSHDDADLTDDEVPFHQRLAKVAGESDRPEEAAVALHAGLQPVDAPLRAPDGSEWTARQRKQIRKEQRKNMEAVLAAQYLASYGRGQTDGQGSSSHSMEAEQEAEKKAKREAKRWAKLELRNKTWHHEHLGPGEEYNAGHVASLFGQTRSLYQPLQMVVDEQRHQLVRTAEAKSAKENAGPRAAAKDWLERNPGLPLDHSSDLPLPGDSTP